MPDTTTNFSHIALTYARALLDLANAQQQAEPIAQEMRDLRQIVDTNQTFALFLADPGISEQARSNVLEHVFKGRVSPLVYNFLRVLNAKGRLGSLAEIAGAYDELLDEQVGKVEVDVTVAQRLSDAQMAQVQQRVSQALGKDAVLHQYVDDAIIGGLVLRVQDQLIDGSVRAQLQAMRQKLLSARPQ
jgi:F-type H+-transporting ATPase subunit delta